MTKGLISKLLDWLTNGAESDATPLDWALGLVLILMASFLWSTVVRATVDKL
jgi:hypothetical protein